MLLFSIGMMMYTESSPTSRPKLNFIFVYMTRCLIEVMGTRVMSKVCGVVSHTCTGLPNHTLQGCSINNCIAANQTICLSLYASQVYTVRSTEFHRGLFLCHLTLVQQDGWIIYYTESVLILAIDFYCLAFFLQ